MQHCTGCDQTLPLSAFYPDQTKPRGVHSRCRECVKAARRAAHAADPAKTRERNRLYWLGHKDKWREAGRRIRQRVLDAYGNACACCGETTPEFLGVDHVNNDGEEHRRELAGYGRAIYRWLANNGFPQDGRFQLLCHNCNIAKGLYGGCPHKGAVPGRRAKPGRGVTSQYLVDVA